MLLFIPKNGLLVEIPSLEQVAEIAVLIAIAIMVVWLNIDRWRDLKKKTPEQRKQEEEELTRFMGEW
jgi:hypothetical protein